jgi:NADPH-dependent 2,4-dienoyl-CoA reductase/sulfur reductase-like enzyme
MASLTPNPADDPKSFRTLYAQTIIQQYHESKGISQDTPLPTPTLPVQPSRPICIIGAGVAGLYAAIMLDFLRIDYEIIEASDRVGGRLFSKKLGEGRYEYFVSPILITADILLISKRSTRMLVPCDFPKHLS